LTFIGPEDHESCWQWRRCAADPAACRAKAICHRWEGVADHAWTGFLVALESSLAWDGL